MAYVYTHQPDDQPGGEVRVCSETNPNDCVVVGHVHFRPVEGHWRITPRTAQSTSERFETEPDAQLGLIRREREAWQDTRENALKALELLEEHLSSYNSNAAGDG